MTRRLRVIWVAAEAPDLARHGLSARDAELVEILAARHDIRVVAADLPPGEGWLALGAQTVAAEGIDWRARPFIAARNRLLHRAQLAALLVADPLPFVQRSVSDRDRAIAELLERATSAGEVDVVQLGDVGLAAAVSGIDPPVAVLAEDRADHDAAALGGAASARRRVEAWKLARWRRRHLRGRHVVDAAPDGTPIAADELERRWLAVTARTPTRTATSGNSMSRPAKPPVAAESALSASVVIVTRNRPDLLREALASVRDATARVPGVEVVIVEQGDAAAQSTCADLGFHAEIVRDPGRGATRARNLGVGRATGAVVLFTDDDCRVPDWWIADHLAALADPQITLTCGVVTGLSRATGDDPVARLRRHRAGALPWHVGHSSNMAVRRAALLQVGGFDERLGPGTRLGGGDDPDFLIRLLDAGGVALSGVGGVVRHADWRSSDEHHHNLRVYERGAGLWIGKAMRIQGRTAGLRYMRARRRLLADRWRQAEGFGARLEVLRAMLTFVKAVERGRRLAAPGEPARWIPESRP